MATKRPDQLPSGKDFEMNDLVMIEKDPDTQERKLVKTSLSDFMGSALKFDPLRFGKNPITGFQSQFGWLMESMNTLSEMNMLSSSIDPYSQSSDPTEGAHMPTPTPSATPSSTPLIPPTPTPTITPSITPTPSSPSMIAERSIIFSGQDSNGLIARQIPNEYMPEYIGSHRFGGGVLAATGWEFKTNIGYYFQNDPTDPTEYVASPFLDPEAPPFPIYGAYPDKYTKSVLSERLYRFDKAEYGADESDRVAVSVVTKSQGEYTTLQTPIPDGGSIEFTIKYLY